ncbi:hypothetical protein CEXT_628501 [Caerostris extrusa]|uniref:C2H2-type domain-containing protein n=1 Tax=Caerostris extrusa TaxID=172846 RepID=A0AAV4W7M8_CAEEX|nr:hypothetical protein CEXT_628501 [Caerostris extrusa]
MSPIPRIFYCHLKRVKYLYPSIQNTPPNIPMSVTEQSISTGSQQTFGQRNALMHQMAQHPSAFSQTECSGISTTNELPPHFSSTYHNFGESDHTLTNRVKAFILHVDTLCANKEESTLNRTDTENLKYYTKQFSLPSTSQNSMMSQEYRVSNPGAVKFKEDDNYPKNKQWTGFSYGISENTSYPSSATHIHQHNFGGGIKNSDIESHTWGHSNLVATSSENKNACIIPNTMSASEVSEKCKKNSADKTFGRNAFTLKKKMEVPQKMNSLYECSKCPMTFRRKDYLESHERCHNVEKPYVCKFCDKAFTQSGALVKHVRSHTGEKPYSCTECSKSFVTGDDLKRHVRTHTGKTIYM